MEAQGEHVLIRKPDPKKATEGGIALPDVIDQVYSYGRVMSVGSKVAAFGVDVAAGEYVVFEASASTALELDPHKDKDANLVSTHAAAIYCKISKEELEARKLPLE